MNKASQSQSQNLSRLLVSPSILCDNQNKGGQLNKLTLLNNTYAVHMNKYILFFMTSKEILSEKLCLLNLLEIGFSF